MTEELFRKVKDYSEKKRKNETAVPQELLETKYKKSYEKLCNELKDAQCQLRARYMESIREVSNLVSETVYMDFSLYENLELLTNRCAEIHSRYPDCFTKELLIAVQKAIFTFAGGMDDG